jgi:hypothetical protein
MALCVTHNISFDPQWEWCIYCGKPKTAELVVVENTSTNSVSPKLHAAVCRACTGDQFRCEGCVLGSEFNPSRVTSGE